MNVRQAILKAADSIEQNPHLFNFGSTEVAGCNTPGCALGWIACHLGQAKEGQYFEAPTLGALLGLKDNGRPWAGANFYDLMDEFSEQWHEDAAKCSAALRLYADKYHPEPGRIPVTDHIPASVRQIFQQPVLS